MKKLLTVMLALVLFVTTMAMAEITPSAPELNYVEKVLYAGDGIFKVEFMRDVAWRTDYVLTVKDDTDASRTAIILGGDANEVYLQLEGTVEKDALYTFSFVSNNGVIRAIGQGTEGFSYANYCEYCLIFGHDELACTARQAAGIYRDVERCNLCGELGHDEEVCPSRQIGVAYCDECGQYGHDDDFCPYDVDDDDQYDRCDRCGQLGHDDDVCPTRIQSNNGTISSGNTTSGSNQSGTASSTGGSRQRYCDECNQYGHDDDNCPNERCDECGKYGHDDDNCPNERCDECGKYGHDDDNCPNERCDECGKYGHDDDNCPNARCDECGKYGHDDDNCPNERCDECGRYGHDDDRCPYDD